MKYPDLWLWDEATKLGGGRSSYGVQIWPAVSPSLLWDGATTNESCISFKTRQGDIRSLISGFKMRPLNIVVVKVCFTSCIPILTYKMRQQLIRAVFLLKQERVIYSTLIFGFETRQQNSDGGWSLMYGIQIWPSVSPSLPMRWGNN